MWSLSLFIVSVLWLSEIAAKKANLDDNRDALSFFGAEPQSFFQADESVLIGGQSGAAASQKCVPIPANMSLCRGIGYEEMLTPNLLQHETVREAMEESSNWLPLANIKCHKHTRLFLCSLLAPLCPMQQPPVHSLSTSDSQLLSSSASAASLNEQMLMLAASPPVNIYPCRSLCESVQAACEGVMQKHGFPWPDILACSRFPLDNDMCITPYGAASSSGGEEMTSTPETTTTATTATTMRNRRTMPPRTTIKWTPRTRATATQRTTTLVPTTTVTASTVLATNSSCAVCNPLIQPAQLDALFCQADFVGKVRFRRMTRRGVFLAKRPKLLKVTQSHALFNLSAADFTAAKSVEFVFEEDQAANGCRQMCIDGVEVKTQLYLIVGKFVQRPPSFAARRSQLPHVAIRLVMPWFAGPNNRDFRQAEKRLQNLKCTTTGSGSQKPAKKDPRVSKNF